MSPANGQLPKDALTIQAIEKRPGFWLVSRDVEYRVALTFKTEPVKGVYGGTSLVSPDVPTYTC